MILVELDPEWIMSNYRPGSYDEPWSWEDEERDLDSRDELSIPFGERPEDRSAILLGSDGRVWDGHHRILSAKRAGKQVRVYGTGEVQ